MRNTRLCVRINRKVDVSRGGKIPLSGSESQVDEENGDEISDYETSEDDKFYSSCESSDEEDELDSFAREQLEEVKDLFARNTPRDKENTRRFDL